MYGGGLNWSPEELEEVGKTKPWLVEDNPGVFGKQASTLTSQHLANSSLKGIKTETKMPGSRNTEEEDLQRLVIVWLESQGWLTHAERKARSKKGWMTPIQGDAGFPDIVAVHPILRKVLFTELKSRVGKYSAEQVAWITAIGQSDIEMYCIDVDDFEAFKEKTKYEAVSK
jgi:hypothetical protein